MDDISESPCKNVYIDSRAKYRRFSGLVENTPNSNSKRLKIDTSPIKESLISTNLAFMQDRSNFYKDTASNIKLADISKNFENNLNLRTDKPETSSQQISPFKRKVGKPRKNKKNILPIQTNKEPNSKYRIGRSLKGKQDLTTADEDKDIITLRREKNANKDLNIAFVEEKTESIPKLKTVGREKRQRRLSGIYKLDLNTGFIESQSINDEEITPLEEILSIYNEERHDTTEEALETADADSKKDGCTTPIKSKLRRRQTRQTTEEDIIKYYTDKTIKKKQNTLETIFETPKRDNVMSVKKYKRFINFNERMSNAKVKKRCSKIVKYNLWQNSDVVSVTYFSRKLKEIEKDS